MDMSKYKPLFLSETAEHFDALEAELIALDERGGDIGHINEVFRHLHSIKSMSASMGYTQLATLAHRLEDMVSPHRESAEPVVSREIDILLRGLDELRQMLLSARTDAEMPSISPRLDAELTQEVKQRRSEYSHKDQGPGSLVNVSMPSWNISVSMSGNCSMPGVRAFMALHRLAQIGQVKSAEPSPDELKGGKLPSGKLSLILASSRSEAVIRSTLDKIPEISQVDIRPTDAAPQKPPAAPPSRPSAPVDHQTVRVRTQLLDFFVNSVGELLTLKSFFEDLSVKHDIPSLDDGVRRMGTVIRKLQERIMEVRMVSVSALTTQLPRVCRDLARRRSKKVSLAIDGTEVELDRALVQALSNPMLHILRNAVEHGIETPEQRVQSGKPEQGTISITFSRRHDRVIVEISDDGAGIDKKKILSKAMQMGIIESPNQIPEGQIFDLMFQAGLSTNDDVTDVSGRGVGMDVVKETIQKLGGHIKVSSQPGRGTTLTMDLPFTLAIIQIVTLETGGHLLALPASRVIKAMPQDPKKISKHDDTATIRSGGHRYQYRCLADLLGLPSQDEGCSAKEVLLVGNESTGKLAIGVDRLTGHREAVLKPIGDILHSAGPFSSSTVLGDGSPILILDVDELLMKASPSEARDG